VTPRIVAALDASQWRPAAELGAQRLAAGALVAFPTETVYGLGARADDDAAVARIFVAKGRPSDHPLIVHVAHGGDPVAAALSFADHLGPLPRRLIAACWPGPLTVIVPRRSGVAAGAAGGQDSIGLRCPDHPVAQALLAAAVRLGVPGVAAPSANRFGRISPTQAQHVADEFAGAAPHDELLVLDGGACRVGIESAIIDCTRGHPVLLRPGLWSAEELSAFAGETLHLPDGQAPRASGTLAAHYAPRASVRLLAPADLEAALAARSAGTAGLPPGRPALTPARLAVYSRSAVHGCDVLSRRMPDSAALAAHELFAVLRELDGPDVAAIWVEQPPADSAWDGVRDRLQRAAAAADPL
jgi:L-threonylcarbamoyladenylate synthase